MPPIGFLPCCCAVCKTCADDLTPDFLTVTAAGFADRVLNASTAYPGRLISPLSVLNRAHQLDRVFVGKMVDRLGYWPGGPEACGVFYESAEYTFGDLFVGWDLLAAEEAYEEESNWARDLVYKLSIGLVVLDDAPLYLGGAADGSGGSSWIGGSILPGELYYQPTISGDTASPSGRLTRSLICSTPTSAAMIQPAAFMRSLKVYNPATLPLWYRADTGDGGGIYWPNYVYTDGDVLDPSVDPGDPGQAAATLDLIASTARS